MVCPDSAVRLVDGTATAGRLEVLLSDQQGWGTVCDDGWSNTNNAQVVCKQLGLPWMGAFSRGVADFGANFNLPILMDDVNCYGNEGMLQNCSRRADGSNNCVHGEDVGAHFA